MPSRRLTFYQEIRDVISAYDRLVLVVGPNTVTSDYVAQEWRFAYYQALRCVNPIVRLNGKDSDGKSIDGYSLIPEDLQPFHAEDFRRDDEFDVHAANLIWQLSEPLPPTGKLVAVPELPPHFFAQRDRIKALRDILLVDLIKPVVVSGAAGRVGIQGMGGIGKSVLASALAHQPEVRRAFPDGVYWVALGQDPRIEDLQHSLLKALGDDSVYSGIEAGKQKLREALAQSATLLVLDNVWQRAHADAFNVVGPRCRLLLTTRDAGLVKALASRENHYQVQLPTASEAEVILAAAAGINTPLLPEARSVIEECGRLPLALALCGGMVRRRVPWSDLLEALRQRDLRYISDRHPFEQQHADIRRVIDASVHVLGSEQRQRFTELAVFALDTGAPEAAVLTLWGYTAGLSPRSVRNYLADFAERSLIERNDADGRIKLHDLVHSFVSGMAVQQFGTIARLHQRLLDAYERNCTNGWPTGLDDGYFLQKLCTHLVAAEKTDDAVALLTNLPWLEAKCGAKQVFSLQDDYACVISAMPETQELVQQERERQTRLDRWTAEITEYSRRWSERRDRIARGECVNDPEPVLPTIPATCQLWTDEEIEAECRRVREAPTRLDRVNAFAGFVLSECYPLIHFGTREGFTLQHAFNYAPSGPVHDAASGLLPQRSAPFLLRRWPEEAVWNPKPAILNTIELYLDVFWSASVTPDGRRAVTGGYDRTLGVWDLESGTCLRVLEAHGGSMNIISVTPDGRRAVTGGYDRTLQVWDLESGTCLRVLEGHSSRVNSISVTPDGRRAVTGGDDRTLRVWDLESGTCLRVLEGHSSSVNSISVTPDGRRAVSGSEGYSYSETRADIRVWDLENGTCLRVLEGHSSSVNSISVTPDGRRAVSGSGSWEDNLRVWDLENGACLHNLALHGRSVNSVGLTPDGRRAVSGGDDTALGVWDLDSGTCLRVLEGHSSSIRSVSVTPDGRRAVSGSSDNTLRVWNLESGTCAPPLEEPYVPVLGVTPDGQRALVGSWDNDSELRVWEGGSCVYPLIGQNGDIGRVSLTPDGRRAASEGEGTLHVWDVESRACLLTVKDHRGSIRSVSVTPDVQRAVSGSEDGTLRVWDLESGACLRTVKGHRGPITSVSMTPDRRRAVSGSEDRTLRVWDLESGACLRVLERAHRFPLERDAGRAARIAGER